MDFPGVEENPLRNRVDAVRFVYLQPTPTSHRVHRYTPCGRKQRAALGWGSITLGQRGGGGDLARGIGLSHATYYHQAPAKERRFLGCA